MTAMIGAALVSNRRFFGTDTLGIEAGVFSEGGRAILIAVCYGPSIPGICPVTVSYLNVLRSEGFSDLPDIECPFNLRQHEQIIQCG